MTPDPADPAEPRAIIQFRYVVLGLVVVVGYFVTTGLIARYHLQRAKDDVDRLRHSLLASDHAAADHWMAVAQSQARSAHAWLAGPAWAAAQRIPWLGGPARVERGIADVALRLADHALPAAVQAGAVLTPSHLRDANGAIRLSVFDSAAAPLAAAAAATDAAARDIAALPRSTWLPGANHARRSADSLLQKFDHVLHQANDAARLAPEMLGAGGTRRYLLVVENDAEARGLGGLPGVVGVVTVTNGRVSFGQFENNSYVDAAPSLPVPVPVAYRDTYAGSDVLTNFEDSDVSPDFPVVAKVWLAMWQAKTGQRLDGAIATDPTALSYLLKAVGPATLPDGTTISGNNVVALTEQQAYARFRSLAARQAYFIEVARAASSRVVGARHGSARALITAMSRAVVEHRLSVFSMDSVEQATLAATPLAGGLPQTNAPFVGVTINNGQASKLDYYIHRAVTYDRTGCAAGDGQLATVSVQLRNEAPDKLPPYVTIRLGATRHNPVGSERLFVALYATSGAQLLGVTADGSRLLALVGEEEGHPRYEVPVTIDRGAAVTLTFRLREPLSQEPVTVWKQPGVNPERVVVAGRRCG